MTMRRTFFFSLLSAVLPSAQAANPDLQELFFGACTAATGALADRCAETTGGEGDLSGDSESSLNPSQVLSGGRVALADAGLLSAQARENAEGSGNEVMRVESGSVGMFLNLHGVWEDYSRIPDKDHERGYEQTKTLVDVGMDYRFSPNMVAGMMLNYSKSSLDYDKEKPGRNFVPQGRAGYIDSDSLGLSAFASWNIAENSYLELSGGFANRNSEFERRAIFQESTRTLPQVNTINRGNTDSTDSWLSINGGMDINNDSWLYGGYASLTYKNTDMDGYKEKDVTHTGLAMRYSSSSQTAVTGLLGVRVQKAVSFSNGVFVPYARAEYIHEFRDDSLKVDTRYLQDLSGNSLRLSSDGPDRNYYNLAAGVSMVLPEGWMSFLDLVYTGGYTDLDRFQATLGLRKEF